MGMNIKKFMKDLMNDKKVANLLNERSLGAPTVTNPGVMNLNKATWKYKVSEFYPGTNPGVGMGAPFLLGGTVIKGVDEMGLSLIYGVQHISDTMAERLVDEMK